MLEALLDDDEDDMTFLFLFLVEEEERDDKNDDDGKAKANAAEEEQAALVTEKCLVLAEHEKQLTGNGDLLVVDVVADDKIFGKPPAPRTNVNLQLDQRKMVTLLTLNVFPDPIFSLLRRVR